MVEASFSSNLYFQKYKFFSLWPVRTLELEQLQFFCFKEPTCAWLCNIALSHLPCHFLVSAAPGNLPTAMYHASPVPTAIFCLLSPEPMRQCYHALHLQ